MEQRTWENRKKIREAAWFILECATERHGITTEQLGRTVLALKTLSADSVTVAQFHDKAMAAGFET